MNAYSGSRWRKWDLHVHTPVSLAQHYAGDANAAWEKFLTDLESLPEEFKVIGINDYIFIDGYKRILEERAKNNRLKNIELVLPVIELRLDKFGGSVTALSRVNYHVIFSNEVTPEVIETQFLSALKSDYKLSPEHAQLQESGEWAAVPTLDSLRELGEKIIASAPLEKRKDYGSPVEEGFNNLCFTLDQVRDALKKHAFKGKVITAVGKTEWADVKWNDNTIAEKKNIINKTDLVFTASESVAAYDKARKALEVGGVNSRLLDCSDAHHHADTKEKDRIGNCFAWIKGDPVFETLRQAAFDFPNRVAVSETHPLMPLLRIGEVIVRFPEDTKLVDEEQRTYFCFRGEHKYSFSPYLTCLVGGRGAGKSTLLNLLHEKLHPGENPFFRQHWLEPEKTALISSGVVIDGNKEQKEVEFIPQNEVEQFAKAPARLTNAVFTRLQKLDDSGKLTEFLKKADAEKISAEQQVARLLQLHEARRSLETKQKELESNRSLVQSFANEDYQKFSATLAELNRKLQVLRSGRERYETLIKAIRDLQTVSGFIAPAEPNVYAVRIAALQILLHQALASEENNPELVTAAQEEQDIQRRIAETRVQLDNFLKARGLSAENQSDVGKATERVAMLDQEIPRLQQNIETLGAEVARYKEDLSLTTQFVEAVRDRLKPINAMLQNLGSEVKPIVLNYEFDRAAMNARVRELILTRVGSDDRIRTDHLKLALEKVDFSAPLTQPEFLAQLRDDGKTAKLVRDFFTDNLNFCLLVLDAWKLRVSFLDFHRIHVTYDGRPIENSSFGQRCTAAIVILLSLGNNPIVIDEPEAHLDSGLIARYLVDLVKRVKRNRQIIFATHNANFVVNGDAELIHILDMGADHKTESKSATIEDLKYRERLLALEGGRDAFRLRERRYGISEIKPG